MRKRIKDLYSTTLSLTHKVPTDITGLSEAEQFTISELFTFFNTVYRYNQDFENGDLSSGVLTVNHNLATTRPSVTIIDNEGIIRNEFPTITVTNSNTLSIDLGGAITGTWTLKVIK